MADKKISKYIYRAIALIAMIIMLFYSLRYKNAIEIVEDYKLYFYFTTAICFISLVLSFFKSKWTFVTSIILLLSSVLSSFLLAGKMHSVSVVEPLPTELPYRNYYYKATAEFNSLKRETGYRGFQFLGHRDTETILINSLEELDRFISEESEYTSTGLLEDSYDETFFSR